MVSTVIPKFFPSHDGSVILQSKGWHPPSLPAAKSDWFCVTTGVWVLAFPWENLAL